ncbi:MAG: hypothetical protein R3253_08225 [Longimicrobiales bacterium]|nr:hypothetical protein [Longimicrobiales bacterium]
MDHNGSDHRNPLTLFVGALGALVVLSLASPTPAAAQDTAAAPSAVPAPLTRGHLDELRQRLQRHMARERRGLESLQRQVDVVTLYYRLADLAWVDEVRFFGPPEEGEDEPRAISALVFVPKATDGPERGSLLVWERGEDGLEIESWGDVPELRDHLERGVTIIAPTYSGAPEVRLDAVPEYAQRRYPFLAGGSVEWRAPR